MRKWNKGSQYRNYGSSVSGSNMWSLYKSNTSKGVSRPSVRNTSYRRSSISTVEDTSLINHKFDYQRSLKYRDSASKVSRASFDGNAVVKLDVEPMAKPKFQPDYSPKPNKKRKIQLEAIKGRKENKGILSSTALSPALVTLAKFIAAIVIIVAAAAFLRVAISSASVSTGIESRNIATQISQELANKNKLEIENSAASSSSKIRTAASKYSLVPPATKEQINLPQDVLAHDQEGNVSLVESLKRVGSTQ